MALKSKNVRIRWNGQAIVKTSDRSIDDAMFVGASYVLAATLPRVPRVTGRLAQSGYAVSATKSSYVRAGGKQRKRVRPKHGEGAVAFASMLAHLVESGVQAHTIKPRRKKALRFGNVVVRSVRHPGMKGRRFLRKTWAAEKERTAEKIVKELAKRQEKADGTGGIDL
jgi:hypothetical protein